MRFPARFHDFSSISHYGGSVSLVIILISFLRVFYNFKTILLLNALFIIFAPALSSVLIVENKVESYLCVLNESVSCKKCFADSPALRLVAAGTIHRAA